MSKTMSEEVKKGKSETKRESTRTVQRRGRGTRTETVNGGTEMGGRRLFSTKWTSPKGARGGRARGEEEEHMAVRRSVTMLEEEGGNLLLAEDEGIIADERQP